MHCIPYHTLQHCHIYKGHHQHWQGPHKHHHHHNDVSLCSDKSSANGHCNKHGHCHQHQVNTHITPGCSWPEVRFYSIPKCNHHEHIHENDIGDHWAKKHYEGGWVKRTDTMKKRTDCGKISHGGRQHEGQCYHSHESENFRQQIGNFHGKQRKFYFSRGFECAKKYPFGCANKFDLNCVRMNKKNNYHGLALLMTCRLRHNPEEMQIVPHVHGQKHVQWCQPPTEINDGAIHCCTRTSDTRPHPRSDCDKKGDANGTSNSRYEENSKQCEMSAEEGAGHEPSEKEGNVHDVTEGTTEEETPTTCSEQDGDHGSTDKDEGPGLKNQNANSENENGVSSDEPGHSKRSQPEGKMDCD